MRLDKFVQTKLELGSRSQAQKLVDLGLVVINGKVAKKSSATVNELDIVELPDVEALEESAPENHTDLLPNHNIKITVVYEDEFLMIIDKQAGVATHPGGGDVSNTIVNGLLAYLGNNISNCGGTGRPGIVHRLDKDTSGLMLIAKTNQAHLLLSQMIATREVSRIYHAICYGVPHVVEGVLESNIARNPNDRKKMQIVQAGGKLAITHYKVLDILFNGLASLVQCKLQTGRTHQIRVHLTNLGNAIIGDKKYGTKSPSYIQSKFAKHPLISQQILSLNRHLLHSHQLSLTHPITQVPLSFTSPTNFLQL